ncbi:MAG: hypothetical protein GKR99_05475 [Rhodobacteraceae bacterium]|nr:hypothetical protein [Paracoccaceae bacterium]
MILRKLPLSGTQAGDSACNPRALIRVRRGRQRTRRADQSASGFGARSLAAQARLRAGRSRFSRATGVVAFAVC